MRNYWCYFVRAIACVLVVGRHAAAPYVNINADANWYQLPLLIEAFTRCSVPLFFMLSGYLALREDRLITGSTVSRRLLRALTPLIFYTAIYVPFSVYWVGHPLPNPIAGGSFYHLWFFYVYAITAMILLVVSPSNISTNFGVIIILGILLLCASGMQSFGVTHGFMHVSGVAVYLLYSLAGYFLAKLETKRLYVITALFVFIVSTLTTAWITMQKSLEVMKADQTFYQHDAILVVLASFSGFYLIKFIAPYFEWTSKPILSLATASLGVFGLHPLFLHIALENSERGSIWLIGVILFTIVCSWAAALAIRRLPYGNLVA